ncbi:hypothetical protein [Streptomyces albidoflavus]|uniref:hypothetical protein n=1 Tax=Streptomyces albidoflavus TaxID=1886 RepID=UPI0020D24EEF|nr:hypothetical protein [Streptomyces albidoflavus]
MSPTARSSRMVVLSSPSGIIPTARKVQAAEIPVSTQSLGLRVRQARRIRAPKAKNPQLITARAVNSTRSQTRASLDGP